MRGFKINDATLTARDIELLHEIKTEVSNGFVTNRYYFEEGEKLDDDTILPERQQKIFMNERKRLAKWKLYRKRRAVYYAHEKQVFEEKQQRDLLLHRIHTEKRNLFKVFTSEKRPNLGFLEYHNWRTYWENYFMDATTNYQYLKQFSEEELTCWFDWSEGIYI